MKKLITICLLATMGVFEAQAQAAYENEVINTIMARPDEQPEAKPRDEGKVKYIKKDNSKTS